MTRYAVALGSNLGDRLGYIRRAVDGLAESGDVQSVSALYESAPVGGREQGPFFNAVVVVSSDLDPFQLLARCQSIEAAAGRVREEHWGPRTLDIDIVASDGVPVEASGLTVPHLLAHTRGFVLVPLVDVWPEAVLADNRSARESLADVGDGGVEFIARIWVD